MIGSVSSDRRRDVHMEGELALYGVRVRTTDVYSRICYVELPLIDQNVNKILLTVGLTQEFDNLLTYLCVNEYRQSIGVRSTFQ